MTIAIRSIPIKASSSFVIGFPYLGRKFLDRVVRSLTRSLSRGRISFVLADGYEIVCDSGSDGPEAVMKIHSSSALRRMVSGGYMGLGEGYLAGEWSTPSLPDLFAFGLANQGQLDLNLSGGLVIRLANSVLHFLRRNSRYGSRKNIADHYDLGNDFFACWLDPSMTYSSALFQDVKEDALMGAQLNKYRRIVQELDIKPNHHVLEIGCGWGGFVEYAARETGAWMTAITISQGQHDYAVKRTNAAGLGDRVKIQLKDYRDIQGKYDRIVSIEMLEAVGETYWPRYFQSVSNCLVKGGQALIQVITVPDDDFEEYRSSVDFIQRYIFPGGMLISADKFRGCAEKAGLELNGQFMFGKSYATTLGFWREAFLCSWNEIETLGFDERFKRLWEYYLAYTAAGFKAGAIDVGQFCLIKN